MTINFVPTEPVARTGGPGRTAEPNPFTDAVQSIAMKTNPKTGKPLALEFNTDHANRGNNADQYTKWEGKLKRQLSQAGAASTPPVTVISAIEPVKTGPKGKEVDSPIKSTVTFWTVARQLRPRKPRSEFAAIEDELKADYPVTDEVDPAPVI